MQLCLLLLATEVLRPTAPQWLPSPHTLLGAMLGIVFAVPVVEQVVAVAHSILAMLVDPLVIAMFEPLKLPRRLHHSTMIHPLNLLMTSSWQN